MSVADGFKATIQSLAREANSINHSSFIYAAQFTLWVQFNVRYREKQVQDFKRFASLFKTHQFKRIKCCKLYDNVTVNPKPILQAQLKKKSI